MRDAGQGPLGAGWGRWVLEREQWELGRDRWVLGDHWELGGDAGCWGTTGSWVGMLGAGGPLELGGDVWVLKGGHWVLGVGLLGLDADINDRAAMWRISEKCCKPYSQIDCAVATCSPPIVTAHCHWLAVLLSPTGVCL